MFDLKRSSLVAALLFVFTLSATQRSFSQANQNDQRRDDDRNYGNGQPGYGQPGYGQPGYGQPGYNQPGYGNDRGQNQSNRIAFRNGTRAGQNDAGRDIRSNRTNVDYTQSDQYGKAPGWNARMGDRNQYKQSFRQGYAQGYQQAWAQVRGNNRYPQRR